MVHIKAEKILVIKRRNKSNKSIIALNKPRKQYSKNTQKNTRGLIHLYYGIRNCSQ